MISINKIKNSEGYEVIHSTEEFPTPSADATILWFALGWKPCTKDILHYTS